jgi:hypothetical protein
MGGDWKKAMDEAGSMFQLGFRAWRSLFKNEK